MLIRIFFGFFFLKNLDIIKILLIFVSNKNDMSDNIIRHSNEMISEEYVFLEKFRFQRLQRDSMWYVTYENHIITYGQYRHDLEEWIVINYFKDNVL